MIEKIALAGMPGESAITALSQILRGVMLRPGDTEYDAARGIWNGMIDRRPSFIVRCQGVADVIAAVNFARDHGLPVAVRGGGHGVAGHAVCDGGMMIDLSNMRAVRVDPAARRAWVQGGATWGDVDCETTAFDLATPGGLISTTGCRRLDAVRRRGLAPQYGGPMRRQCDIRRCGDCRWPAATRQSDGKSGSLLGNSRRWRQFRHCRLLRIPAAPDRADLDVLRRSLS